MPPGDSAYAVPSPAPVADDLKRCVFVPQVCSTIPMNVVKMASYWKGVEPFGRVPAWHAREVFNDSIWILSEARQAALEGTGWSVLDFACKGLDSSRAVQGCFDILAERFRQAAKKQDLVAFWDATFETQAILSGLRGHVVEASKNKHANHVIKHLLDILPTEHFSEHIALVASELSGKASQVASDEYGCRIAIRLVRHRQAGGSAGDCASRFINELLGAVGGLCNEKYAMFVLDEFLVNGFPEDRRKIVNALRGRLLHHASRKYTSGLIIKVLGYCDADGGQEDLADELLRRDTVLSLVKNKHKSKHGMYVLKSLAQRSLEVRQSLLTLAAELQSTCQGSKLLEILSSFEAVPQ